MNRDRIDIAAIHKRLGHQWEKPSAWSWDGQESEDAWFILGPGGKGIIVSIDPASEPGTDWLHASVSYRMQARIPSYADLKELHAAVFGDGHAYQCFVPPEQHINIRSNVLHLWGRLDGKPALPDFGRFGTI